MIYYVTYRDHDEKVVTRRVKCDLNSWLHLNSSSILELLTVVCG